MKRFLAVMVAVLCVPAVAAAQQRGGFGRQPGQDQGQDRGFLRNLLDRQGQGGRVYGRDDWRNMLDSLPGALGLMDRLEIAADQTKVLSEIHKEWSTKRQTALTDAMDKIGRPTREDFRDAEKMRDYFAKIQDARQKAPPAPAEQVTNVLTPEQLQKVSEANQAIEAWGKTVAELVAKYNKQLDELVGSAVKGVDLGFDSRAVLAALDGHEKGTSQLVDRLSLTKEQIKALQDLARGQSRNERNVMIAALVSGAKLVDPAASTVRNVINSQAGEEIASANAEAVAKILTDDQKARIKKAAPVVLERNKALTLAYAECAAKVANILPVRKEKPAEKPEAGAAPGAEPGAPVPPGIEL